MRAHLLKLEFIALFAITPILVAFFLPPKFMFIALFIITVFSLFLLNKTPNFNWKSLIKQKRKLKLNFFMLYAVGCLALFSLITFLFIPKSFFALPQNMPILWLIIMLAYPIVSVLPQELIFRPLFFIRYASILPIGNGIIILNAGAFSLVHLMYWNWIALIVTFAGGVGFAHFYKKYRNFLDIVILHAIGGCIIFTTGAGRFFYSGAAQ
jgi:membrane protease YdiL (CAAX protease family)